jgi:arylsulfatase
MNVMPSPKPNIILILTDQQRPDCLSLAGHPVVQTPYMDWIAASGTNFSRAYTECPSCIAARRTIMTGLAPASHGMVGYRDKVELHADHFLAEELTRGGYQTQLVGKLHLHPDRKRFGFESMILSGNTIDRAGESNDYTDWLRRQGYREIENGDNHGVSGWIGRPHVLPEDKTHSYWLVSEAMQFLEKRDPTVPFFLNLSFFDPHPPFACPSHFYDHYIRQELPEAVVGDWVERNLPSVGMNPATPRGVFPQAMLRKTRAAYYGMISHLDHQIGRLMNFLKYRGLQRNTFILFASDHGEMLGDHHLVFKSAPYEASARVPFFAKAPDSMGLPSKLNVDAPVGLQDIMPTLLDVAGLKVPKSLDGKSLLPFMRGRKPAWRKWIHGEHSPTGGIPEGMHYLVDEKWKYIWFPKSGKEQLFDLQQDPNECSDLSKSPGQAVVVKRWRERLVQELRQRPEGFVKNGKLVVGRPYANLVP